MLDPSGSGHIGYRSFVENNLRDGALTSGPGDTRQLHAQVFGHLHRFLRRKGEKEMDWFRRHAGDTGESSRAGGSYPGWRGPAHLSSALAASPGHPSSAVVAMGVSR